jgi:uncharacterized lipoprotein YmbA
MTSRRALLASLVVPTLLAACGHSPPTQFLTLDVAPPASGALAGYQGPPIRVPAVRIPPALDREEFTQKASAGEMKVDDFVRWSGPLGLLARSTLIRDLAARLPPDKVSPPDAPAQAGGLRVDVSILSLEVEGRDASLQAAYAFAADDGLSPVSHQQWATLRVPTTGATPLDTARAYSALLGVLADRITADLAARGRLR